MTAPQAGQGKRPRAGPLRHEEAYGAHLLRITAGPLGAGFIWSVHHLDGYPRGEPLRSGHAPFANAALVQARRCADALAVAARYPLL